MQVEMTGILKKINFKKEATDELSLCNFIEDIEYMRKCDNQLYNICYSIYFCTFISDCI